MGFLSKLFKSSPKASSSVGKANKPDSYGGVSLSELNSLAANFGGGRVKKWEDRLTFTFRSNRKRNGHSVDFRIKNGKLDQMSTVADYRGRTHFYEKDFMNAANEKFHFKGK